MKCRKSWENSYEDSCRREKERKTQEEVEGQSRCGLEVEGTVGIGDAKPRGGNRLRTIDQTFEQKWEKMQGKVSTIT